MGGIKIKMELTVENVIQTLPSVIDEEQYVYMDFYENVISPIDFVNRFKGAELTFNSLMNHPNTTAGWKNQFTSWYEKGILA
jgi:hypothetical protein